MVSKRESQLHSEESCHTFILGGIFMVLLDYIHIPCIYSDLEVTMKLFLPSEFYDVLFST